MAIQPLDGANAVATILRRYLGQRMAGPPQYERGVINDDLSLKPDSWNGQPFPAPENAAGGEVSYLRAEKFDPDGETEPALVGVTIQGTSVEHTHPARPLQAGDRVLLIWLNHGTSAATPVVMERVV